MGYRNKLNPEHSLRTPHGIKGTRQKKIIIHSPSEIDQNQFPTSDDIIGPGTAPLILTSNWTLDLLQVYFQTTPNE